MPETALRKPGIDKMPVRPVKKHKRIPHKMPALTEKQKKREEKDIRPDSTLIDPPQPLHPPTSKNETKAANHVVRRRNATEDMHPRHVCRFG